MVMTTMWHLFRSYADCPCARLRENAAVCPRDSATYRCILPSVYSSALFR